MLSMKKVIHIGRAEDNQIIVAKQTVNKYHARIIIENEKAYLEDNNSLNGTYVNGQKISEKILLNTDDKISLADNISIDWSALIEKKDEKTTSDLELEFDEKVAPTQAKQTSKSKIKTAKNIGKKSFDFNTILTKVKSALTIKNLVRFLKANWDLVLIYGSILLMVFLLQEFIR